MRFTTTNCVPGHVAAGKSVLVIEEAGWTVVTLSGRSTLAGGAAELRGYGPNPSGRSSYLSSAPVLVVDAPLSHRDALLTIERERLIWAAGATGAPQLHPEDLRCVPDGTVSEADARLSGVVLTLGMACRIEEAEDAEE
ncbi:MAG: hypothetical protein EXR69_05330 [Myxococcales bacterium]|nr:hypothetical protein [Myxococcales bacterium]